MFNRHIFRKQWNYFSPQDWKYFCTSGENAGGSPAGDWGKGHLGLSADYCDRAWWWGASTAPCPQAPGRTCWGHAPPLPRGRGHPPWSPTPDAWRWSCHWTHDEMSINMESHYNKCLSNQVIIITGTALSTGRWNCHVCSLSRPELDWGLVQVCGTGPGNAGPHQLIRQAQPTEGLPVNPNLQTPRSEN